MMRAVELVFAVGWAAFWMYWLVAAFSMKRGRVPWSRELRIRAVIVVIAILLLRLGAFRGHGLNSDPWRAGLGLVLFALGLGFAIWARVHIGRNWGTPMSQKDEPELVTSGPYHLVRHPIYSGVLVAGVGTAVALSWLWLIAVAPGRGLLRLQRDRRGALPDRAVPRHLPGVQALDQDARALHLLRLSSAPTRGTGVGPRRRSGPEVAHLAGGSTQARSKGPRWPDCRACRCGGIDLARYPAPRSRSDSRSEVGVAPGQHGTNGQLARILAFRASRRFLRPVFSPPYRRAGAPLDGRCTSVPRPRLRCEILS